MSLRVTYLPGELPENGLVWLSRVRDLLRGDGVHASSSRVQHLHLFLMRLTTWKCTQLSKDNFTLFYTDIALEMKLDKLLLCIASWKTGTFGSQLCVGHTEIISC